MGRPAVPLDQFVLKVHSRCDLACDHCYVYEAADQNWRGQPKAMPDDVIAAVAGRIAGHAARHGLAAVHVVLHGGEPLLAGPARLARAATGLRSALAGICDLDLRIHTNGVLLSERFCALFAEHGIKVGISIDGGRAANDRHRRYADGRSSYDQVVRAIGLLRTRFRDLYAGLLCTIDIANDPIGVYEALAALDPPNVDFLLPHATWASPPPRPAGRAGTPYADWLLAIYRRWLADGQPFGVRTFDSVISTSRGGDSFTEALGLGPSTLLVVETDGSYEQADSLKAAFDGAPATGLDVFRHSLDTAAAHPGIAARQQGLDGLSAECQACPVVTSCGGGLYAHRHKPGSGFANPSVYCADLLELVTQIRGQLPAMGGHRLPRPRQATLPQIPDPEFRSLATGLGDADVISHLNQAQRFLTRVLLSRVYHGGTAALSDGSGATASTAFEAAWELLTRLDQEAPAALAAVLSHPFVRVWAVRCLEQLRRGQGLADLSHLSMVAAATAIRAGAEFSLPFEVCNGIVPLPTLGRLLLEPAGPGTAPPPAGGPQAGEISLAAGSVTVKAGGIRWHGATAGTPATHDGRVYLTHGDRDGRWEPLRRLTAAGFSVALEDTDPYRDCYQRPVAPRLTDEDFAAWQDQFAAAWQEIGRSHQPYAAALAEGLTTITPLTAGPEGREVSGTARQAYGAVAAARPGGPVVLALLLIHEFQHVKMGAVLDSCTLFDPSDRRLYHAPWREDLRPLEGLLQGTYAHLAVADFWRQQQRVTSGQDAEAAGQRFATWRDHTAGAIEVLAASGSLTPLGTRFVDEMRHSPCLA